MLGSCCASCASRGLGAAFLLAEDTAHHTLHTRDESLPARWPTRPLVPTEQRRPLLAHHLAQEVPRPTSPANSSSGAATQPSLGMTRR